MELANEIQLSLFYWKIEYYSYRSQNFKQSSAFILIGRKGLKLCIFSFAIKWHDLCDHFRYWSHVVNYSNCSLAYKRLNILDIVLQVVSIASIGIVAAGKQGFMSATAKNTLVSMAALCFVASEWLSHFIYKTFDTMITTMPFAETACIEQYFKFVINIRIMQHLQHCM